MKRKGSGLDLSLAQSRDAKKLKHEREGFLKKHREIISAIFLSFALGAGSGLVLTNVKVSMDGPESPKIPLIQKIKYDVSDWWNGVRKTDVDKPEEKIEAPGENKDDSKIHINLKPPSELDCGSNKEDCLVS